MKKILSIIILFFPWKIRRFFLIKIWKYDIHSEARIGFSYIYPRMLKMAKGSEIGHLNVAVNLELMVLGENASIARLNWITGFPVNSESLHFKHQKERRSELILGDNSAITKHHHIDCTNQVNIGSYVTIAGYYSQLLTHSINIEDNRQDSKPIKIGDYSFIGTNSVILGGAVLPSYSVLGAKALLNKAYEEEYVLYGGIPAKPVTALTKDAKYFKRTEGYVY
ncbi:MULTISPECIES: acyltransferase [Algibacter]|uniref:Acyltransferase n=1 Tax=Algibacter miyuki TaxID=1306933 RepID=A0ABV5GVH7_9FLAO|nr:MULTISPECIES: acyltransferase [Algibacter]MDN3664917.1 acyltransferase [Algibacter miyuki]MWW24429.1 acyltransferase [Algibacter lectus]